MTIHAERFNFLDGMKFSVLAFGRERRVVGEVVRIVRVRPDGLEERIR